MRADASRDALDADAGKGARIAVLQARFNASITDSLREAAVGALTEHGVALEDVHVFAVPGAWELGQVAARVVETARYHAVIALGCVIRGGTPHFDYVAGEAARGLQQVAVSSSIPVIFGVLTTDDVAQAEERSRPGSDDNKGRDAALAALEMIGVYRGLEGAS